MAERRGWLRGLVGVELRQAILAARPQVPRDVASRLPADEVAVLGLEPFLDVHHRDAGKLTVDTRMQLLSGLVGVLVERVEQDAFGGHCAE